MTTQRLCPVDGTPLIKMTRNGIEIEYCPTCGGVWLDHGELEKLIELASKPQFGPPNLDSATQYSGSHSAPQHNNQGGYHHKKKKESWLGEIFDF